jgi:hypothetical protein
MLQDLTGIKSARKIANNTLQIDFEDGAQAIRLHLTNIITWAQGNIILNSGGWQTVTTKSRLNQFLPQGFYIHSERGLWYVRTAQGDFKYYDGMIFNQQGALLYNALMERGYRPFQYKLFIDMNLRDTFKRCLRAYLVKRLIK